MSTVKMKASSSKIEKESSKMFREATKSKISVKTSRSSKDSSRSGISSTSDYASGTKQVLVLTKGHDYRRDWIRDRMMAYLGVTDQMYFEEMMAENDGYLEKKLDIFMNNTVEAANPQEELEHRIFFMYKTWVDRLFEEEVFVQEIGNYK